jgi:hypothetical protein
MSSKKPARTSGNRRKRAGTGGNRRVPARIGAFRRGLAGADGPATAHDLVSASFVDLPAAGRALNSDRRQENLTHGGRLTA